LLYWAWVGVEPPLRVGGAGIPVVGVDD
jgi:hypothetical protein